MKKEKPPLRLLSEEEFERLPPDKKLTYLGAAMRVIRAPERPTDRRQRPSKNKKSLGVGEFRYLTPKEFEALDGSQKVAYMESALHYFKRAPWPPPLASEPERPPAAHDPEGVADIEKSDEK